MTGGSRGQAPLTTALLRVNAVRPPRRHAPGIAIASAMAIALISGSTYSSDSGQVTSTAYRRAASAGRRLCGAPYKMQRPIAPELAFHDPRSRGVRAAEFCPNGSYLAAADGNGRAYLWSMATHKVVSVLIDPRSRGINALAYRPKRTMLATADANGSVYLWPPGQAGPRRLRDPASKGVRAIAFSPSGMLLAAADGNGHCYIWSMTTYKVVAVAYDTGSKGVNAVAFNSNGKALATGDANGDAYIWVLSGMLSARLQARLRDPQSKGVDAVAFRPKSETLASADGNGSVYVWIAPATQPRVLTDPVSKGITAESFTPRGQFLATADGDGHLYFWAFASAAIVGLLPVPGGTGVRAVAISSDGRRTAAGDANGTIYVSDSTRIGISVVLTAFRRAPDSAGTPAA